MLYEFLKRIQAGEVQSLLEIARLQGIPQAMAAQMADELARKGYLQAVGQDCDTPQAGCSDCPVGTGCQVPARRWFLTEKGKKAVSGQSEPRET
jgi:hypothetical protein